MQTVFQNSAEATATLRANGYQPADTAKVDGRAIWVKGGVTTTLAFAYKQGSHVLVYEASNIDDIREQSKTLRRSGDKLDAVDTQTVAPTPKRGRTIVAIKPLTEEAADMLGMSWPETGERAEVATAQEPAPTVERRPKGWDGKCECRWADGQYCEALLRARDEMKTVIGQHIMKGGCDWSCPGRRAV